MRSLRLHTHAETDEKVTGGKIAAAVLDEHQPGCFALEEERGSDWMGSGVQIIKERASLRSRFLHRDLAVQFSWGVRAQ